MPHVPPWVCHFHKDVWRLVVRRSRNAEHLMSNQYWPYRPTYAWIHLTTINTPGCRASLALLALAVRLPNLGSLGVWCEWCFRGHGVNVVRNLGDLLQFWFSKFLERLWKLHQNDTYLCTVKKLRFFRAASKTEWWITTSSRQQDRHLWPLMLNADTHYIWKSKRMYT